MNPFAGPVVVDKQTDISLRTHLAQLGLKTGDLSKFVENAVKRQLFARSWSDFAEGFGDLGDGKREALAEEAVGWARSGN